MQVNVGETKQDKYTSGTYNGVYLNIAMLAAAVNTALAASDFVPSQVAIKATLRRGKGSHTIFQDNLQILGTAACLTRGYHEFVSGLDKTYAAAGVAAIKLRSVFLPFYGHIRVDAGDTLLIEVNLPSSGAFTANVATGSSFIEFWANPSIGYETHLAEVKSEVVQETVSSQPFSLGDNVTRLAILNFDKNDLEGEVISMLSLSSDRLDKSYTFNQLLAETSQHADESPRYRYGSTLPIPATAATGRAFRGLDALPQSFLLFDGEKIQNELDQCRLNITFNSANVAASQNYVVWTTYQSTQKQVNEAVSREQKHIVEKVEKMPTV